MKIGIFSDSHICLSNDLGLGRNPIEAKKRLVALTDVFKSEGVEAVICLGDLVDKLPNDKKEDVLANLRDTVSIISTLNVPFYLVSGNHDFLILSRNDFANEGISLAPFLIKDENACIIALDANFRDDTHHFDEAGEKWDDAHVPSAQLEMLDRTLCEASVPCIVLIHENLDPCVDFWHQARNADEVRVTIAKHAHKVKTVIQGHFHWGSQGVYDGIPYETVKSICVFDTDNYKILDTSKL